ncbi:hypothetical protein V8B55DRAFT_1501795 [Mucor lusitanicus]|uniref:Uncharacterized protein n=1 Tax=Mucor circinelloides f. lusitanicus TaxID=29924 RepID=A0A8H4BKI9_MUCCL|nr:hypothetical protein FB192DRAFT_1366038 [Mucor lusitanicus]
MFSLKQKWKALGQNAIHPASEGSTNSASMSNASAQPSLQQQQASSKVVAMESKASGGDAEPLGASATAPSPSTSSTSAQLTARESSKPIDIKYFVPKYIEPEGLSQSVMISDHDYIHRQLVKRYKMREATAESTPQGTPLRQEAIRESSNEDVDYLSTDNDYYEEEEEDSLSVAAAIANKVFSKSVPLLSSMSNYPRFAWPAIAPPDQENNTKNDTNSPLFPIRKEQYNSETELQLEKDQGASLVHTVSTHVKELAVPMDEQGLVEWIETANECYGEVSVDETQLFVSRLYSAYLETPWDRTHRNEYALERLKHNEFIHILFKKYSVPMKVTNVAKNARFKQVQHHLHNPNILYMRYIQNTQTIYVVFRRYTEMMRAIDRLNCIRICGKTMVCRPSSYVEYDKACKDELKRKLGQRKIRAAKRNGKSNKKTKNIKSKPAASARTNNNAKQQHNFKQRRKPYRFKNGANSYGFSYYPCFCLQCTNPFLYSARK